MEKYNNCIGLNNKNNKRDLQKRLQPKKDYLKEYLANDFMMHVIKSFAGARKGAEPRRPTCYNR